MEGREMTKMKTVILVFLTAFSITSVARADFCTEPVETKSGKVRGMADSETATCSWKGIPYAAPPVGELRWRSPEPVQKWDGILEATKIRPICMQNCLMAALDTTKEMSEDCLYLNIWRPAKSGEFPVMLWIHGGGYTSGSGGTEMYWGDRLAAAGDVVVVTFNYRLNVFGFFAHPELRNEDKNRATGGQGSLDQVAAIKWVNDNIEAFGGDPGNITIFGESAGGWSVCTMVATPLNRKKFNGAIMESGGCVAGNTLEKGYRQAEEVAKEFCCNFEDKAEEIACLRKVPAKRLLKPTGNELIDGFVWQPHYDGYLLTDSPLEMIKEGNYNKVNLIAGFNLNEADILIKIFSPPSRVIKENYPKAIMHSIGCDINDADTLARLYPFSNYDDKPKVALGQMFSEGILSCPTYNGMFRVSEQQSEVYFYRFDYTGFRLGGIIKALHAMEIPYVFNSMDRMPFCFFYGKKQMPAAEELSRVIQGYWVNFAHTGNPNGDGLPEWEPFLLPGGPPHVQVFNKNTGNETPDMSERCAFWEEYNRTHYPLFETMGKPGK